MAWIGDMAKNEMEALMFRDLTDKEEEEFRQSAREIFEDNPDVEINDLWHPVVRQELRALKKGL